MSQVFATVLFGLAASLAWGSGDFCGGLASRRVTAVSVVMGAYVVGFFLLTALAIVWREPLPGLADITWSVVAGLVGVIGLVAFYSALAVGSMGIVAPVSAVLTAGIPVVFSIFTLGWPGILPVVGFALALLAIVLISRPERTAGRPVGLGLILLAGCGFGGFFILISRVSHGEVFWPLAIARFSSVLLLVVLTSIRRQAFALRRDVVLFIVLGGVLDALGNAFFVVASHMGRLDIAALFSSLYPAATVILATLFLRERVTRIQILGIVLALVAIPLISI